MNYLQKIKQAIDARLEWKECNAFYIGKTSDFEERKIEHENDHYNLCWELAHGIPEQISELENALICTYKGNSKLFNNHEKTLLSLTMLVMGTAALSAQEKYATRTLPFSIPSCP